jgi:type I restriction enzyme M protein
MLGAGYAGVPDFCKSVSGDEIAEHGYVLTPGRFAGVGAAEEDAMPFPDRFAA